MLLAEKDDMSITICPYCKSENTQVFYSVENMPTILSAVERNNLSLVKFKDFEASICLDCCLGFNSKPLTNEELKTVYENYLTISPFNNIGQTKFSNMLEVIYKNTNREDRIVELGCSEGFVLKKLIDNGYKNVLGIEPGPQANIAIENNIPILKDFYKKNILEDASVDCFILLHVFEHFSGPFDCLNKMKSHLTEYGKLFLEFPNFGGFHHEHLFFYNQFFMKKLTYDYKLNIKYEDVDLKNGVLRYVLTKNTSSPSGFSINGDYYKSFSELKEATKRTLANRERELKDILKNNSKIYWWGAGSASVCYLNKFRDYLKNREIIVIDGDKNKYGKIIPGVNLEVKPFFEIKNKHIDTLIIASSFFKEIMKTIDSNNIKVNRIKSMELLI